MKLRKIASLVVATLISIVALSALYVFSLDLEQQPLANPNSQAKDIAFIQNPPEFRGRILAVVTSTAKSPKGDVAAGMELTELSRAYYTFIANGYDVHIASPDGGRPPVVIDDDLIDVDYAFLNDAKAQEALSKTLRLQDVDTSIYDAVYFVGGKGAMFDFPGDQHVTRIAKGIYESGGIVGAVCHGPAALIGVNLSNGLPLLEGRSVTGFTNEEELFLIPNARDVFPFLLEDQMKASGAKFIASRMYLENTVVDGRLITGQNPWSTWSVAEEMVRALGHEPKPRERTREEHAVELLEVYWSKGFNAAKASAGNVEVDKRLLLMHAFIAAIQGNVRGAYHLQALAGGD